MDEFTLSAVEVVILAIGSSGLGGLVLAIISARQYAKKSTVEDLWLLYGAEKEKRIENEKKVKELEEKIDALKDELEERDELIVDLKDWIERLLEQFKEHVPNVRPVEFIRRNNRKV